MLKATQENIPKRLNTGKAPPTHLPLKPDAMSALRLSELLAKWRKANFGYSLLFYILALISRQKLNK